MIRVKESNWIPWKGFRAVNVFGVVYVRKRKDGKPNRPLPERILRHEYIHTMQMKELWYILFYVWYGLEWVVRTLTYAVRFLFRFIRDKHRKANFHLAYKKILFEQEARGNEDRLDYPEVRKKFTWIKYLRK